MRVLALCLLSACTAPSTPSSGTGTTGTSGDTGSPVAAAGWERDSLYYLMAGRVCMSATDGTGTAQSGPGGVTPLERYVPCVVDEDCTDAAFPACGHMELAGAPEADLEWLEPTLQPPLSPADNAGSPYRMRYVPLCEDGSGDHEYSLWGSGTAPTCAPEQYVRCADGTRPSYYVNPGTSDRWIIWAGQGGYALRSTQNAWLQAHRESDSFGQPRQPNNRRLGLEGIFSDDQGGTDFNDYTRVRVDKCSPDRWLGRSVHQQTTRPIDCANHWEGCTGVLQPPMHDDQRAFDVYLHGDRIVSAVFADLATGPDLYDDYETTPRVADTTPALASADQVLLTCWSNGCNGLHMSLDDRADQLRSLAGSGVDVRAVFNNFFTGSLEGEWGIDETSAGEVLLANDWYDHVTTGFSIARIPGTAKPAPISDATYDGGTQSDTLQYYSAPLDSSCLAFHGADSALCNDGMHVLANHLQTPFFYSLAQTDASLSTGGAAGGAYCEVTPGVENGCDYTGVQQGWQHLVRKQAADLHHLAETERCEAGTEGPAPYDASFIWAPKWDTHASWASVGPINLKLGLDPKSTPTLRRAAYLWATDVVGKGICLEVDPDVHPTASNAALKVPVCVPGPLYKP